MPIRDQTTLRMMLCAHAREALAAEGLTVEVSVDGPDAVDERLARALERIAAENERKESLSALGQIGAGVTHEVRNAMTGVLGFAQVARTNLIANPATADEQLQLIGKESQRCLEILTHYLTFSRPRQPEQQPLDVGEALHAVARLVQPQLRLGKIALDVEVAPNLPAVVGDAAALRQVLLNLVLNAIQALCDDGGRVRLVGERDDGAVLLKVVDDGPGVPPELAKQIFDPFFTTKPVGQGTGMGLAVSRGLVEEQGGTLSLESPRGGGATFIIRLPGVDG